MTSDQESKCHAIIHSAAIAAGVGNLTPVPTTGYVVDICAMIGMTTGLAAIFGGNITDEVAKGLAITALKEEFLKHPIKVVAKELSKLFPPLGELVAPAVSVGIIEAAGWALVNDMERHFKR